MLYKLGLVFRRQRSTVLSLAAFFLLAGLLAGCGGSDGAGSGSQNGGGNGGDGGAGGGGAGGAGGGAEGATESKIALGRVVSVKPDNGKIVLREVAAGDQAGKRMVFKVKKNARITLDDKQAELADAKESQQAQIEHVGIEENNRGKTVELFASDAGTD